MTSSVDRGTATGGYVGRGRFNVWSNASPTCWKLYQLLGFNHTTDGCGLKCWLIAPPPLPQCNTNTSSNSPTVCDDGTPLRKSLPYLEKEAFPCLPTAPHLKAAHADVSNLQTILRKSKVPVGGRQTHEPSPFRPNPGNSYWSSFPSEAAYYSYSTRSSSHHCLPGSEDYLAVNLSLH